MVPFFLNASRLCLGVQVRQKIFRKRSSSSSSSSGGDGGVGGGGDGVGSRSGSSYNGSCSVT